jgi:hypothetical protein
MPSGAPALTAPAGGWQPVGRFDPEQVGFAATIVSVGAQMGVPVRGRVIAVAVAIQESGLHNPDGGDQDSIGLFQQRPSQGWGTPQQLHDPVYASQKFFEKLLTIPDWQTMALTDAAQAVQTSAHPDAYAKQEPDATLLINTLGTGPFWASPDTQYATAGGITCTADGGDGMPGDAVTLPPGFELPTDTAPAAAVAIYWALGQLGTPYSFGGDCTAAHAGDPAHECDCSSLVILSPATWRGCDLRVRVDDGVLEAVLAGVFDGQRQGGSSPRRDAVRFAGSVGVAERVPGDAFAGGAAR